MDDDLLKAGDAIRIRRDADALPPNLKALRGREGVILSAGDNIAKVLLHAIDPEFPPVRLMVLTCELERSG